ncbi:hypothetical protein Dsin_018484 [Dipteronia sinensis]|uniref:Uncharacterized protein n=1 Tax=Dipteronia sinensis TaxID=43782 RepID=A0AAE0A6U6_9ROSI|nr:hypothetical protein Dsin_018484 [Dipteronia sinensis]
MSSIIMIKFQNKFVAESRSFPEEFGKATVTNEGNCLMLNVDAAIGGDEQLWGFGHGSGISLMCLLLKLEPFWKEFNMLWREFKQQEEEDLLKPDRRRTSSVVVKKKKIDPTANPRLKLDRRQPSVGVKKKKKSDDGGEL